MNGSFLDTNVVSEFSRDVPDPRVERWLRSQGSGTLYLSAISIGEIRRGLVLLPAGRRRTRLKAWYHDDLLIWFAGRILPVTERVADAWGVMEGQRQLAGMPLSAADGMIAATALTHGLLLVTRNVRDFAGLDVAIHNPWGE